MADTARAASAKKARLGSARQPQKKRRASRRTAEQARLVILDAAEKRLVEVGPAGLRLQEVAADAGVAHPTILHHFGSRKRLIQAVVQRALAALYADLMQEMQRALAEGKSDPIRLMNRAFQTLSQRGQARLWVWLALSGQLPSSVPPWVREIAKVAHAARIKQKDV